jgi:trk system potassium uptake protein TrkA
MGAKRVISRVSRNTNAALFEQVGIDIAISSKTASLNEIKNNIKDTNIGILATVEQGQGEVLEISVKPEFSGKKIMDLAMPSSAIIGVIQRRNNIIIPKGDTDIRYEDILIIFTKADNANKIKEFFKVN